MKKVLLLAGIVLATLQLQAQNYKFGKVSIDEVKDNVYEKDTSASAVKLYKNRNTYFSYEHPDGWVIVTEVHERVKILNKDGLDYATKKLALYNSNKNKERITNVKGLTYNVNGGKLTTEKLRKKAIFKEEKSKNWTQASFTMPNASEGSILEWSYKITSPFWKIDDLEIQEDIPTEFYHAKIKTPEYFIFKKMVKGGYSIYPKEYRENRNMRVTSESSSGTGLTNKTGSSTMSVVENVSEYELTYVPALKEEPYVNNINNYRLLVTYELSAIQFPNRPFKNYATSWEEVVNSISKHDDFGKQLDKTKFLRDKASEIKASSGGQEEIVGKAYDFVRGKMNWNGNYGKYTNKGIQKAFKENTGNVSEINLTLVGLLREAGITANPVLISTRKHGIPIFPTLEGFNYVVAGVTIGNNTILLDATDKDLALGTLPPRALNWEGTMVLEDGQSMKVNLFPTKHSQFNSMMNVVINEDGSIEGKRSTSVNDLDAYAYRKAYKDVSQEELEESIMNDNEYDDLSDLEMKNMEDLSKPVSQVYNFELDDGAEVVGDEIYFSPLFSLALDTNPFVIEERLYPVDFIYPRSRRRIVNVSIPEGYQITSLPKPVKMNLPDGLGSFLFNISETPNGINVMSTFKINSAIIPVHRYQELKEFYNQRVKKETEKVVLKKI